MMRSAAKLAYEEAQAAIDGQPSARARAAAGAGAQAAVGAPMRCWRRPATGARRSTSICPSARSCSTSEGRVERVIEPRAARGAPPDRGVHDPGQRGGRRDAGGQARARRLPRARCALEGEARRAARVPRQPGPQAARRRHAAAPATSTACCSAAKSLPVADLVNEVVLRSQAQAVYAADNLGHFGLNLRRYAHFTSPIRRYADLLVHRSLIRALRPRAPAALTDAEAARLDDIAAGDLGRRAPRHGGRARDHRPADRRLPRRPRRRRVRRAHLRASRARACSCA